MNIGFLYGMGFRQPGTGGSIHGYQLARGLIDRGHRLFSWYYGDDENPMVTHFRARQVLRFLRTIDVLYLRVGWDTAICKFHRLRWLRLGRLPIVWELNGHPDEMSYLGYDAARVAGVMAELRHRARSASAAIGVTDSMRDCLRDRLGIARSYCIPNGSDPALFSPDPDAHDAGGPLTVAWIGAASCPWHDIQAVLQAAETLRREHVNVRFSFYARRDRLPETLPANVTCEGVVPYVNLGKRLAAADVGLHVFRPMDDGRVTDGSPLKLFDYMACGLAVIGQDAGQTGQVIRERHSGLLTTGSADDLVARVASLAADRDLCRQLGRNGRRAVEEYYNWPRVAAETEAVLAGAVENRDVDLRRPSAGEGR